MTPITLSDGRTLCPYCKGTGADPMSDSGNNSLPCKGCGGSGSIDADAILAAEKKEQQ